MAKRKKKVRKLRLWVKVLMFILILILARSCYNYFVKKEEFSLNLIKIYEERLLKQKQDEEYEVCVAEKASDDDYKFIENKINELNEYLTSNYSASIYYEELDRGFKYTYNIDKSYYAASTMKTLDAIYLYDKAISGEINLDDTMTYTQDYRRGASAEMKNHSYGDKISLRTLVKYAITVSDNTAHEMLVSYIGKQTLSNYGKSLGATLTLSSGDNFGYINVTDAAIYLKKLNELFKDETYGEELKELFTTSDQNYLILIDDFDFDFVAHKYGEYESVYHDISVVFGKRPYYLVILTSNGYQNHEELIKDIGIKINEIHELFHENRKNYCDEKIYGE